MKRILILFLLTFTFCGVNAKDEYILTPEIKPLSEGAVKIGYNWEEFMKNDTIKIKNTEEVSDDKANEELKKEIKEGFKKSLLGFLETFVFFGFILIVCFVLTMVYFVLTYIIVKYKHWISSSDS